MLIKLFYYYEKDVVLNKLEGMFAIGLYDKDKKNGKLIRWYANGQKSQEEFYKNDEKHGKFKYWFDNGRLEKEEKFSNGVQTDGKHYDYFDN